MSNVTIRNVPDAIANEVRLLAKIKRRSINNQYVCVIEEGLRALAARAHGRTPGAPVGLDASQQLALWQDLLGTWEDTRSPEEVSADIHAARTKGREVEL